ncbi:DUF3263 domain-containing protein [Kineococcus terrestris]|uniref:DUF3263 domain-containing protein n=1 Tax=Kineococcus terrestris TaxID=2044856 RepID=UPI0034DB311F
MLQPSEQRLLDVVGQLPTLDERVTAARLHVEFGNVTRAWQRLNALLEREDALAYAPATVHRLRRYRDQRNARRTTRRVA